MTPEETKFPWPRTFHVRGHRKTTIFDCFAFSKISISGHGSSNIFVVGHHDYAANPVDNLTHKKQINTAVKRIKDLFPDLNVIGLWINENFTVEKNNLN